MKSLKLLFALASVSMLASCGETKVSEGQAIANEIAGVAGLAINSSTNRAMVQGENGVNKLKSPAYIFIFKTYSKQTDYGVKTAAVEWTYSNPDVIKESLNDEERQRYKVQPVSYPAVGETDLSIVMTATVKYTDEATSQVYTAYSVYNVTFLAKTK